MAAAGDPRAGDADFNRRPTLASPPRTFPLYLRLLFCCLILFVGLVRAPAPARAAGAGTITGQIVAKGGATAITGTPIVLAIATGAAGTKPEERTARAGDDGAFRFEDVPLMPGAVYLLKVLYDGGSYFQEVEFPQAATTAAAPAIEVYPATRQSEAITFQRDNMIISVVDQNGAQIIETGAYRNDADRAYIGPAGARDATTLRFGLPQGAVGLQPAEGLNRDTLVAIDEPPLSGFATLEAVRPGEHQFAYVYRLGARGRTIDFDRVFPYRTQLFTLYLPTGLRLETVGSGPALGGGGETTLPNGQKYRVYTISNLAPNSRVIARITNLPTGEGSVNPLLPALAIFTLLLGIGLIVVYGRRRAPSPVAAAASRRVRTVPAGSVRTVPAGTAQSRVAASLDADEETEDLAARRERLVLELADLDDRHDAGELSDTDYRKQRTARKDELLATLRAIEARDGAPAPARRRS